MTFSPWRDFKPALRESKPAVPAAQAILGVEKWADFMVSKIQLNPVDLQDFTSIVNVDSLLSS
jgi:hypothetical protein